MKILGVDPGIHGGLAIVEPIDGAAPQLIDATDIPVVGTGAKERVERPGARFDAEDLLRRSDHREHGRREARHHEGNRQRRDSVVTLQTARGAMPLTLSFWTTCHA